MNALACHPAKPSAIGIDQTTVITRVRSRVADAVASSVDDITSNKAQTMAERLIERGERIEYATRIPIAWALSQPPTTAPAA